MNDNGELTVRSSEFLRYFSSHQMHGEISMSPFAGGK